MAENEIEEVTQIDEDTIDTYINLLEETPVVGTRVEVLCYLLGRRGFPVRTFFIYRGTVQESNHVLIVLNPLGATELEVDNGRIIHRGAATLNTEGTLVLPPQRNYNTYWKSVGTPPTMRTPTRGPPPREAAAESVLGKRAAEDSPVGKRPILSTPTSVGDFYGGKRTKSRKMKRKSRRKK